MQLCTWKYYWNGWNDVGKDFIILQRNHKIPQNGLSLIIISSVRVGKQWELIRKWAAMGGERIEWVLVSYHLFIKSLMVLLICKTLSKQKSMRKLYGLALYTQRSSFIAATSISLYSCSSSAFSRSFSLVFFTLERSNQQIILNAFWNHNHVQIMVNPVRTWSIKISIEIHLRSQWHDEGAIFASILRSKPIIPKESK